MAGSTGMRQYYLMKSYHTGTVAQTARSRGNHFASMWELADPSDLKCNTELGYHWGGTGQGPPTERRGWVRTGSTAGSGFTPGMANCEAWTSDADSQRGTTANLPSDWASGTQKVGVWIAESYACDSPIRVWCVQDSNAFRVVLPLMLKH